MVNAVSIGETFIKWAEERPEIASIVLFGSQSRKATEIRAADSYSDWDFQVVSSNIGLFRDRSWTTELGQGPPVGYTFRAGRFGEVQKATVLFNSGELDLVLLPLARLQLARVLVSADLHLHNKFISSKLSNLSAVLKAGYKIMKGGRRWETFFAKISLEIPFFCLTDTAVIAIGDEFFCEYIATKRKIDRGEFIAAQRWLHCKLFEFTLIVLNELRSRQNKLNVFDARRLEFLLPRDEIDCFIISTSPTKDQLNSALLKISTTFQELIFTVVGSRWEWPIQEGKLRIPSEIFASIQQDTS